MTPSPPSPLSPLVSVVVPAYNHAAYVEVCLDSIAAETYPELELIVLDDGSRDDTLARVTSWVEKHGDRFRRTKVWTQPNAGICRTFNRLVAEARGDFVTIVASDDALLPGGIEARVRALLEHPGRLAVFADAEVMDGGGRTTAASAIRDVYHANTRALLNPARMALALIARWCVPGPVFLARREAWDPVHGVGPYRETLVVEDRDFYLRLMAKRALGFIDRTVARYRIHDLNACLGSMREAVHEDVHRSHVENLPLLRGMERFCLWILVRHFEAKKAGRRLELWLMRRLLALIRGWMKRI